MVSLLVPVKRLATAKSRLGVPAGVRQDLVRAFALDTLIAAIECPQVHLVALVTDEPSVTEPARELGCVILPDEGSGDLNAAVRAGVSRLPEAGPTGVLFADLPCLRSDELGMALTAIGLEDPDRLGFVADAARAGTTLLAAGSPGLLDPHFGVGSRAAHLAIGAHEVLEPVRSLRQDVDVLADLDAAMGLGVGRHTAEVLART